MGREFRLPDLGSGLQEATILAWRVAVGDTPDPDGVLVEVETEKAVIDIPVPFAGVVSELRFGEGETVKVGEVIAVFETEGAVETPASEPRPASVEVEVDIRDVETEATTDLPIRPTAMPLVRKLARNHGVDLESVTGTGLGGRVTRADVEALISSQPEMPISVGRREPLSKLRKTIADHMTSQWQTVPHMAGHTTVSARRLTEAHTALKARLGRVPMEALIALAVIPALRTHPSCHAAIDSDEIEYHDSVHLGFALDIPDGLLVPVVRHADRLRLAELAESIVDLAGRGRDRKLKPEELGGQTFTISNIGPLGGDHANQIVPKGTTAIMSIGRIQELPAVRNGEVVPDLTMALSFTFDHRAVDGGEGQRFINDVKAALEEPSLLFV